MKVAVEFYDGIIGRARKLVEEEGGEISSRQIRALARAVAEQMAELDDRIDKALALRLASE